MTWLLRKLRNWRGRLAGWGWCRRCGDSWAWKPSHTTMITRGMGVFQLCEPCWQALTPEERVPYYHEWWLRWGLDLGDEGVSWPDMVRAIMAEDDPRPLAGVQDLGVPDYMLGKEA